MKHTTRVQGDELFCTGCHRRWGRDETEPLICEGKPQQAPHGTPKAEKVPEHMRIIGMLVLKLAVHEPNSEVLKTAREYLRVGHG